MTEENRTDDEKKEVDPADDGSALPAGEESSWLGIEDLHLNLDEVRQEIFRVNNMAVDRDDPALAYVTIMNACLDEQQKLMNAHLNALSSLMAKETGAAVESTRKSADSVIEATQKNMKEVVKAFSAMSAENLRDAGKELASLRSTMKLCTGMMAASALLVVAVFVLKAMGVG